MLSKLFRQPTGPLSLKVALSWARGRLQGELGWSLVDDDGLRAFVLKSGDLGL